MSETIAQTITRLTALIKEKAPTIDLAPGSVFNELIVGLDSQVQNQVYNDIGAINAAQSINQALSSLDPTFDPVIDSIASNYSVTRNQGTKSYGTLKVYVTTAKNYTIPANIIFIQPNLGYTYTTLSSVLIDYQSNPAVLTQEDGLYFFALTVVATDVGQKTAINSGTQFSIGNPSQILGFVKAAAQGNFNSGLDLETDKELILRFRNGLGVKNLLSQNSIGAKFSTDFAGFKAVYLADTISPINLRSKN